MSSVILNGKLILSTLTKTNVNLKHIAIGLSKNVDASKYKYTLDDPILNASQRDEYERNGFLVVRRLIKPETLEIFKKRFQEVCLKKIKIPGMTVMKDVAIAKSEYLEGEKAITKIQDFCHDDELFKYCCLPEIVQYVKAFVGSNVQAMHTMLINKPPGIVFF
jgi:phytanoyl-CoA hydroxylase